MIEFFAFTAVFLAILVATAIIRIIFSKNTPERIVALDTINTLIVVIMIVLGGLMKKVLYIDIAIVYGLLSFIGTVYIARYLENKKGL